MSRRLSWLLPLLLLAACAIGPGIEERMAAQIGRSEVQLVEALGVPTRTHEADGLRFLQYEQRRQVLHQLDPYWGRPYGRFAPLSPAAPILLTRSCDVTFTIRSDRVQSFTLRGDDCR
ncbi:hypothetical protein JMJ55_03000 [Belnapia sp. T6]|uniref:Uncharacterized protein n=1 Tax=Belnapia mucosa TaxID=2804532 RepID=A0ABS1UXT0_9PROT|nr:hypothetical protein [Belnapia mucosa]MBL6454276.1 hypothetical protein [Belnapia mucosa]